MEFIYFYRMKRPIEKIDFENFEDIANFSKVLQKKVNKALKENQNYVSFNFKNDEYKIDLNNFDFYLGYIYGLNFCNSKDVKVKQEN